MARRFTSDYREEATLRDGSRVLFRLVRPGDKQLISDGLARMSPESRLRRFFSHRARLSAAELAYLTELDQERHFALAAGRPAGGATDASDGEVGLGVARFIVLDTDREAGPITAEAAIAVVDEAQGQGLGRMLFERLVIAASERGVGVFRFDVLAQNDTMLGLIQSMFPAASSEIADGIMTIDCPLPDFSSHVPGDRPDGMLYRMLKLAAAGAVRVLRGARESESMSAVLKAGVGFSNDVSDLGELIGLTDEDGPAP